MMPKLFQIERFVDCKDIPRIRISCLGLRFCFPIGNFRGYIQKKRRSAFEKSLRKRLITFRRKTVSFLANKQNVGIRRLFITSGNFHLVTTLALIEKQKRTDTTPVENHIIVWSSVSNDEFEQINQRIAGECGIERYHSCCGEIWDSSHLCDYVIRQKLYDIDEVYTLQRPGHLALYNQLYPDVKRIITDEGVYTLAPPWKRAMPKCASLITTFYLSKLDYMPLADNAQKVEHLEHRYFQMIADKCAALYPWEIAVEKKDRAILFCATYAASWTPYTTEELRERQESVISQLIEIGFTILYKPHPRDEYLPAESSKLKIVRAKLPLECYALNNIMAVVSLFSSASTQSYHYSGVPGFIDPAFSEKVLPEYLYILALDYTPSIDSLLAIDAASMSADDLQRKIQQVYEEWLQDKPLLSRNARFLKAFDPKLNPITI